MPDVKSITKEEYQASAFEEHEPVNNFMVALNSTSERELDEQISSMMRKDEGTKGWTCTMCGKAARDKTNLSQHIEANHIEGASHTCNLCGKVSRSRHSLAFHMYSKHKA